MKIISPTWNDGSCERTTRKQKGTGGERNMQMQEKPILTMFGFSQDHASTWARSCGVTVVCIALKLRLGIRN